jgi:hypothetical protein
MAFGSGKRFGEKFADGVGGESGPSGEEIVVDGFRPSGDRWAEAGAVEEVNELDFVFLFICAVRTVLVRGMGKR